MCLNENDTRKKRKNVYRIKISIILRVGNMTYNNITVNQKIYVVFMYTMTYTQCYDDRSTRAEKNYMLFSM